MSIHSEARPQKSSRFSHLDGLYLSALGKLTAESEPCEVIWPESQGQEEYRETERSACRSDYKGKKKAHYNFATLETQLEIWKFMVWAPPWKRLSKQSTFTEKGLGESP